MCAKNERCAESRRYSFTGKDFDGKVKVDAHLLTRITIVVMSAAKKTKPPKELRAMIDVRLSLAP